MKTLTKLQKKRLAIRSKVSGTAERPRISINKSNTNFYAQIIDDEKGITLCATSSLQKDLGIRGSVNIEKMDLLAKDLVAKAKAKSIERVVFDRRGYLYHGMVKAFADACRKYGLKF